MALQLHNSLTRRTEESKPLEEGRVGMYVCGPTVCGHAKSYVGFDVLVRYLRYLGYRVTYVQNITDVGHLTDDDEDKIEKAARKERTHPMALAEHYTRSYFEDMDRLNCARRRSFARTVRAAIPRGKHGTCLSSCEGFAVRESDGRLLDMSHFGSPRQSRERTSIAYIWRHQPSLRP